ncbi:hypothetical protein NDU88_003893 [Pleurodeles waltl]|uniref:Uncharacterized protein n=1 Tax=Pleurodeles waltl TaxID=8319 RepID=A0AAV7LJS3_PLEWA|nr:hypothetical protein NDU88_003893 [Pleurodeles waltl]
MQPADYNPYGRGLEGILCGYVGYLDESDLWRWTALSKLLAPLEEWGLCGPDNELYYAAAQLQWSMRQLAGAPPLECVGILDELATTDFEQALDTVPPKNLDGMLLRTAPYVWSWHTCTGMRSTPYAPSLTIWAMPECVGLKAVYFIRGCDEVGTVSWADMMSEDGFCTFDTLVQDYRLGPKQFLLYLALRDVMQKTWRSDWEQPPLGVALEAILSE